MNDNKNKNNIIVDKDSYISLNATTKLFDENGNFQFQNDLLAVDKYLEIEILPKFKKFDSTKDRIEYLLNNNYYDLDVFKQYSIDFLVEIFDTAKKYKHHFRSFMGAMKFYTTYALKSFDNKTYLEHFEDRVVCNALLFAKGNQKAALKFLDEMMNERYQAATPTFLNAGKRKRGEYVSCYLIRVDDNMESIARAASAGLQLSKRGGGVAYCLTNLREFGAPIKNIENQATGIIPVMKILEDIFSYANQLGQRQGAGAVYLNIFHPDILRFLDSKRENADEKIRIKSLSLGVVVPDIAFELAKENKEMALFSPYDVEKEYKKPMTDISITKEYYNLLNNPKIKKTYISARKLFQLIAEVQFESGYPFLLFDDTANQKSATLNHRIIMSNLCTEIIQVNTPSALTSNLEYKHLGEDVCCNLGSLNIAKVMENAANFEETVRWAVIALNSIAYSADLSSAPTIENGNANNRAIGLGAMNLHGFLATNKIYYDSEEAIDFTNMFFYALAYFAYKASNELAIKTKFVFKNFKNTKYADGSYFNKYIECEQGYWSPKTKQIKELLEKCKFYIPSKQDWINLKENIIKYGLANSHLLAVAPTGSISYLSSCTPSLQPIVSPVEIRKEGKTGRIYVPAYKIGFDNYAYYAKGAYEMGVYPIIDICAAAQQHVDQAISMTLFLTENATTRDLNKAYIYAFNKKCLSIYYIRIRQEVLKDSEKLFECTTCVI
ncbi:MAG: class 1b ribonucleoside-diphosphate reductase subunit alpha [Malacoplasma sp.]|nr:class 1b ribonucleoside-diphosphate reductase subunit alpha [Malacoplasma sp.]